MARYLPNVAFTPSDAAGLPDGTVIFPDLASATLGYASRDGATVAVYDEDRCIEALMANLDCDYEDAREYYDFNTMGTAINRGMPFLVARACDRCGQRFACECEPPFEQPKAA